LCVLTLQVELNGGPVNGGHLNGGYIPEIRIMTDEHVYAVTNGLDHSNKVGQLSRPPTQFKHYDVLFHVRTYITPRRDPLHIQLVREI